MVLHIDLLGLMEVVASIRKALDGEMVLLETYFSIRHASTELDSFMLVQGQHCQAESPLFDTCLIKKQQEKERSVQEFVDVCNQLTKGEGKKGRKRQLSEIAAAVRANRQLAVALGSQGPIL
ncbi:MAG TPA: hypothetical protein VK553_08350 [Candidatus Nitrosopolaris rasttigaisensis]|nr:hypothetical protein [Candidatus Nitrosopolaris rasttigaisensis]